MMKGRQGIRKFVCRTLLALLPVAAFLVLYIIVDPFKVVHPYDGISIAPSDTLERMPNKRYVAVEGLKYYNPTQHYDSFIFGSSISSNFTAAAWAKHLPDTASIYHFTAGAETLSGIRDELRYLIDHGYPVRHALLIMEEEMFSRPKRYEEMPFVPHYDVSPAITRLHFHRLHFNAFRDPYLFLYKLWPTKAVADKLLEDGKMTTIPSGRDELINEDSSLGLDSVILGNPDRYYAERQWLVDMVPTPNPKPLCIDADALKTLLEIADLLNRHHIDYVVIVPPQFRKAGLSPIDHAVLCEIMGQDRVNDFSHDSELIHDLHSYYDGVHILTWRCSQLIDRCYSDAPALTFISR
jgi:hypothetical protein